MPLIDAVDQAPINEVEKDKEECKQQKKNALIKLKELSDKKVQLKRPVFFVPGWTDESCSCWMCSCKGNNPIKYWFDSILTNFSQVTYIDFVKESPACNSFFDFGEVLKNKIWNKVGESSEFDVIGHSMGGLDIRAAIVNKTPLLNIRNCLTVATPHQGDNFGGVNVWSRQTPIIRAIINRLVPQKPYQVIQSKSLDPDYEQIKSINESENKNDFLKSVGKLYQFKGTRDFTVKGSAYISEKGLSSELCKEKIQYVEIDGADHVGKVGITQDPRTILAIIKILLDVKCEELEELKNNHGIFIGGVQSYKS